MHAYIPEAQYGYIHAERGGGVLTYIRRGADTRQSTGARLAYTHVHSMSIRGRTDVYPARAMHARGAVHVYARMHEAQHGIHCGNVCIHAGRGVEVCMSGGGARRGRGGGRGGGTHVYPARVLPAPPAHARLETRKCAARRARKMLTRVRHGAGADGRRRAWVVLGAWQARDSGGLACVRGVGGAELGKEEG
jgi:hypothetical protein